MAYLAEVDVKVKGHHVFVGVDEDTGKVEFSIDGSEKSEAKSLENGKVLFYREREIAVKDSILTIKEIDLAESDFRLLKGAQDRILLDLAAEKSEAKKMARDYRKQVTTWKRKVKTRRLADKSKEKYCIHDITIGADHYSFYEHIVPQADETILINPNYRLTADISGGGGRVARYGEVFVWEYYEADRGWYIVRELSYNEKICVALIYDYGYFSKNNRSVKKKGAFFKSGKKKEKKGAA